MSSNTAAELVQEAAKRLQRDLDVSAGLEDVAQAAEEAKDPAKAAKIARRRLLDRVQALDEAQTALLDLTKKLTHWRAILPYSAEGWPRERDRLQGLLRTDPAAGLIEWLDYWYAAAGDFRLEALDRFGRDLQLPGGAALLGERGTRAVHALKDLDWDLAAPMLSAGLVGRLQEDGDASRSEAARGSLQLLLARLALRSGQLQRADELLRAAAARKESAAILALRARWQRLSGDQDEARSLLERAQESDPGDLDAVVELIRQARDRDDLDTALGFARVGVDALTSLLDVDSDLGRVIEPPAELWIAVADRARQEQDPRLVAYALDRSEELADPEDLELLATVAERKAEVADPGEARVLELLKAGDLRSVTEKFSQCQLNYGKALSEASGKVPARLRALAMFGFADSVQAVATFQPLHLAGQQVAEALRYVVDGQAVPGVAASDSWNYLVEVMLRVNLARRADIGYADQYWRAFLAAARAVALSPADASRWSSLAFAAGQGLGCYVTADIAAGCAVALGAASGDPSIITVLSNMGRYDEALTMLAGTTDPWNECFRAWVLLLQGKEEQALRLLQSVTIDPSWIWAQLTLLSALLLTERAKDAVDLAMNLAAGVDSRLDEYEYLGSAAQLAQVRGDFDRARELADRMLAATAPDLAEGGAAMAVGQALMLSGEPERGLQMLSEGISLHRSLMALDFWTRISRPQLEAIGRLHGVEIVGLDTLEPHVTRRRQQLRELSDPAAELVQIGGASVDPAVVASARSLASVLMLLARGEEARAEAALPDISREYPDEVRALRAYLQDLAKQRHHEAMATQALRLASAGDRPGAKGVLIRLIEDAPEEAHAILKERADSEESLVMVAKALGELAREPQYYEKAAAVVELLDVGESGLEPPPRASIVQLMLPRSWFADHPDPVKDHPLFVRYLPEILSADLGQAPVYVSSDDALEPDGYTISIDGTLCREGRMDPAARYFRAAALPFLPPAVQAQSTDDPDLGWHRIPAEALGQNDRLAQLLTMDAVEAVARLVGEAVRSHQDAASATVHTVAPAAVARSRGWWRAFSRRRD